MICKQEPRSSTLKCQEASKICNLNKMVYTWEKSLPDLVHSFQILIDINSNRPTIQSRITLFLLPVYFNFQLLINAVLSKTTTNTFIVTQQFSNHQKYVDILTLNHQNRLYDHVILQISKLNVDETEPYLGFLCNYKDLTQVFAS